jgi:hypothetical protein
MASPLHKINSNILISSVVMGGGERAQTYKDTSR